MKIIQTAERVSDRDLSDNYVYQRSLLAYVEASKLVSGNVLEIGTGSGYGVDIIAPCCDRFVTVDKFNDSRVTSKIEKMEGVEFHQITIPPLEGIPSDSFDYVISFQVIEHIQRDDLFIQEAHRVLKKGGKLIVTTPNIKMSLTRNPWHVREYTVEELKELMAVKFSDIQKLGVFGNDLIMDYYKENKASVAKITRWDILNLQYRLPRFLLQIPYDILNRRNRKKILSDNGSLVQSIKMSDYYMGDANDDCFDLFYIATK